MKTAAGKIIPLDAEPVPDGNMVVVDGVARSARVMDAAERLPVYKSHFATCTTPNRFRKPRA